MIPPTVTPTKPPATPSASEFAGPESHRDRRYGDDAESDEYQQQYPGQAAEDEGGETANPPTRIPAIRPDGGAGRGIGEALIA